MRPPILYTANSARSQVAEGPARYLAGLHGLPLEVHSAGTRAAGVNPHAVKAMAEVGIDLSGHASKTLLEVPDPWNFDLVLTVCDAAAEACPAYPARTRRLHRGFPDPAGAEDEPRAFREVRDRIGPVIEELVLDLKAGREPHSA